MEENRDYHAYRYGDHLTPGSELKIEHSVVCENVDISTLITMGTDSLEAMRQGSIDGEQKAYEIVVTAAKQWEQQAAATQTINRALEYLRTPEIEHTGNQWKDTDNWRADQKISNRVYQMTCSIWEDTKYDRETKQSVPIAWYVTWEVRIHSPKQGYGAKIAGQNQKRYTDKNAAIKYLDGRKKAYSHLFTEISPPIPKEYEHHFMVHGTLLPGYTVEGLEQAKTEHAAAEVSEGGIFTPENQEKPSVLGKLSVAKTQEKTPTTPGTAMKKKEDGEHSVLFSTHITGDLERAADYITYISYGELYFTGSKDDFVDMFRIVKGGIEELSDDLKNKAAGIRTFPTGFEALMKTEDISGFPNLTIEPATIDEIVVFTSKKGDDYE